MIRGNCLIFTVDDIIKKIIRIPLETIKRFGSESEVGNKMLLVSSLFHLTCMLISMLKRDTCRKYIIDVTEVLISILCKLIL